MAEGNGNAANRARGLVELERNGLFAGIDYENPHNSPVLTPYRAYTLSEVELVMTNVRQEEAKRSGKTNCADLA